jgi:hypothetical protein
MDSRPAAKSMWNLTTGILAELEKERVGANVAALT